MVSGYHLGSREAWLIHKPIRLEQDEQGRLHCPDALCIQYSDGWGFYAWHGVLVSEQVILHPERLTREDWLQESNLEVGRIIQERRGPGCFIAPVECTCIGPRLAGKTRCGHP